MITDIKHKHAGHVIIIEGQAFKANDAGQWDLTDIWQTLKLPKGKAPAQWRTKQAQRLIDMQNLQVIQGRAAKTLATKRATIEFAGWVSDEFKDMVYDAFEAILELPEVALIVADKMVSLGNDHSASILKRMTFNDKCQWSSLGHRNTVQGLRSAIAKGNLTEDQAATLAARDGLKGFAK